MLPLLLLSAGCSEPNPARARQAWLVDAIVDDNLVWLSRDTELLRGKFEVMAADPFDYMRGTTSVFVQDLARPGAERSSTTLLDRPEAAEILLIGDPHPENIGTLQASPAGAPLPEGLVVDFNDLDGVAFGPYLWDLRRAALGLSMLGAGIEGCLAPCRDAMVTGLADGYLGLGDTAPPELPTDDAPVGVLQGLLAEAVRDGIAQSRVRKYSEILDDGSIHLAVDPTLDDSGSGMLPLTAEERRQVQRLMQAYQPSAPAGFRVLDAVRRFGTGVASRPAIRYVVLYDLGQPWRDDDGLLMVRELVDPPALPGLLSAIPGLFADNADRALLAPRLLWANPATDPWLAGLPDGDQTFKVSSWSGWEQGVDHVDLASQRREEPTDEAALVELAAQLGRLLRGAHDRAPTARGGDGGAALEAQLRGQSEALRAELVSAAQADFDRTMADYQLFNDALDRWGPLLGADW